MSNFQFAISSILIFFLIFGTEYICKPENFEMKDRIQISFMQPRNRNQIFLKKICLGEFFALDNGRPISVRHSFIDLDTLPSQALP